MAFVAAVAMEFQLKKIYIKYFENILNLKKPLPPLPYCHEE
jgi:hypothetical protein